MNQEFVVDVNVGEHAIVTSCGLLDGERFSVFYRVIGDCGVVLCDAPFSPSRDGQWVLGDGVFHPSVLHLTLPGRYVFKPDGIVAVGAQVYHTVYQDGCCK